MSPVATTVPTLSLEPPALVANASEAEGESTDYLHSRPDRRRVGAESYEAPLFAKVEEEIVPDISTNTNDHIVPRMYLKRFAIERPGGPQLQAAHAETPDKEFPVNIRNVGAEKSFY